MKTLTVVGPWVQTWPLEVVWVQMTLLSQEAVQTPEVGMVRAVTCPSVFSMATGGDPEAIGSCGFWEQHWPWTSTQIQVEVEPWTQSWSPVASQT